MILSGLYLLREEHQASCQKEFCACMHVCVCLIVPNLTCNMERRDIPQQECGCSSATSATSSEEEKLVRFIAEVKGWLHGDVA